jgi:alpha-glucuronidase
MINSSYDAWLQSASIDNGPKRAEYISLLQHIVVAEQTQSLLVAKNELIRSAHSLLDTESIVTTEPGNYSYTMLGTTQGNNWVNYGIDQQQLNKIGYEGYLLQSASNNGQPCLLIIGGSASGVLYGVFHLLRLMRMSVSLLHLCKIENPVNPIRMINQWDNADGSIERGYSGNSIFYRNGEITQHTERIRDYARLLASIGINRITINNVNVHHTETSFITDKRLPDVARIADVFRDYGIQLFLCINFASPMQIGGLSSADPLDIQVRSWWNKIVKSIYEYIPDFGGFLVKADSEHRPGPFTYGRDHADGANMLGEALKPYGGIVIWRCFVYDCMQDWRDRTTDRAKAAYDHFIPLDGAFLDNVILQIKNGPMDFQVREPVSPLFGALSQTNQVMEFQITQEYTGQQKHLCYLVPQWKEVLDFDTHVRGEGSTVSRIASGELFQSKLAGFAAVSNIGDDMNWTGHLLAQANLYGFGRLIWNPEQTAEDISIEWVKLTFNTDERVVKVIQEMLMKSWTIYENYTAPLGVGWMVVPHYHYGPDVDGYEYSRWGTYHFADRDGVGVDRTVKSGTGYTTQYAEPNASMYESIEHCPDELLLFFHHVNYTHHLQSGKTVIQHIYDTHFEGVVQARWLVKQWMGLEGLINQNAYSHVLNKLKDQVTHAQLWCDVINTYFYRKSGIPDMIGRKIY